MAAEPHCITIAIAEDHPMTLEGLRSVLSRSSDFEVVGHAANGADAIALHARLRPDVTLVDLLLPDMTGADAIRAIRAKTPTARIIVLTSSDGSESIHRCLENGARAYLLKTATGDELAQAIRDVHAGRRVIPDVIADRLAERAPGSKLTDRERDVLERLVRGGTNRDIAKALGLGEATVRTHTSSILLKLGVNDRAAAVAAALRRGIVR